MGANHQVLTFQLRSICLACVSCAACPLVSAQSDGSGQLAFRVRSDFSAGLNSDKGWGGNLNETVTVFTDRPFRVRFEVEPERGSTTPRRFQLQYRRNGFDWTDVEAHDFPHPEAEVEFDFESRDVNSMPAGWSIAQGEAAELAVRRDGRQKVLRARGEQSPLIALYTAPWELTAFDFETRLRLSSGKRAGAGLIFGYVDADNYFRVFLDSAAGTVRVSRIGDGSETVLAEERVEIPVREWLEVELEFEGGELEVNYGDGALEFTVEVGDINPTAPLGVNVPAENVVEFLELAVSGDPKTPRVSIISCPGYENGAATTDLLRGSTAGFHAGAGVCRSGRTPSWTTDGRHGEFEWALVIRRFADGAVTNEEGDVFDLRMVDADGIPVRRSPIGELRLSVPPGHVGGTFVETPGRIGPFQAANGDLYFIMEPAETDNLFMMMKSTDHGRTWREVDGTNRPDTDDLESVDARHVGHTIHIIHQVTCSTRYHAFRTSDHPRQPDTWSVKDEQAASAEAIAQAATVVVRSDGSLVAFYVGQRKVHYKVRSPEGVWGEEILIDPDVAPNLAGPQAVLGLNDTVHLACYGTDGTIWYRSLLRDGALTERQLLATGAGTTRAEYGSVLPLLFIPETNTVVIIYRLAPGALWERRIVNNAPPTAAVRVTDRDVITDAVDSQQPGADAVLDGRTVRVLFIEPSSRSIFSTHDTGGWQSSTLQVDSILGSWVRGSICTRADGSRVYGYVYDAGSDGGAGMNRFGELQVERSSED